MLKKSRAGACTFALALGLCNIPLHAAEKPIPPCQPTEFALMMWGAAPGTPQALQRAKECGLNIAGFATPAQLDDIAAAGLQAFVWPDLDGIEAAINDKKVTDNPAFAGYLLGSEFREPLYPQLARAVELFKRKLPNKIPLMNLLPQLDQQAIRDRLDLYVKTVKPSLLCYDTYALMEDGTVRSDFWESLKITRGKALESNIPFWNVVQASGHMDYREPTEADFRFQAYSTLAYGGRGIVYFTYKAFPVGNYRGAPVDQYGHETPAWQYLQNTNKQVLALAPIIMKLKSDEVYHFGEVPAAGQGPSEKSLVKDMKGDFLIGDFTHEDGSRYVLIVNKNLQRSKQVEPDFRDAKVLGADRVSVYNEGQMTAIDDNQEERYLAPGQGMLLRLRYK